MRAIKALVIFMGFLIVLALGLLGYGMYSTANRIGKSGQPDDVVTDASTAPASFGAIGLDQPTGSRVTGTSLEGGILSLQVEGGGLPDRVILVDLAGRSVLGTVHLGPAEPAR